MQAFVPKNRRPKFDLHFRIIDLNNVPLVSGTSFIKWHFPHSTAAEHRGRTEKYPIKDHKVSYDYDKHVPVRLTVDKNGMLQEYFIHFEVVQEYSTGGRGERIVLGNVKLNLAEYVEQSEMEGEEGVCRRYLMQDSKINSTLKISIYMKLIEGDKNFIAPPLKTAQVFGGIAGIIGGEQGDSDDAGTTPSLSSKSREAGELQDMYRRTLAAYWTAQPGELKADECIEDIFAGGDGWGAKGKHHSAQSSPYQSTFGSQHTLKPVSGDSSESEPFSGSRPKRRSGEIRRKSHETLRPGDAVRGSPVKVRNSPGIEQQAHQMNGEADRSRPRPAHEVDEFEVREDLRSWRFPSVA